MLAGVIGLSVGSIDRLAPKCLFILVWTTVENKFPNAFTLGPGSGFAGFTINKSLYDLGGILGMISCFRLSLQLKSILYIIFSCFILSFEDVVVRYTCCMGF